MGAAANPGILNALRAAMAARGQQAGAGGGQPPAAAPGASGPDMAQQVNSQMANLRKVSPQQVSTMLKQMKTLVARLIVQTEAEIPGVARYMAPILRALDGAMKEAGNAQQAMSAVQPLIGNSSAGQPSGGSTPPGAPPSAGGGAGAGLPG